MSSFLHFEIFGFGLSFASITSNNVLQLYRLNSRMAFFRFGSINSFKKLKVLPSNYTHLTSEWPFIDLVDFDSLTKLNFFSIFRVIFQKLWIFTSSSKYSQYKLKSSNFLLDKIKSYKKTKSGGARLTKIRSYVR